VESNKVYTYSMITVDDAGLKSELAAPIRLKMRNKETLELVTQLSLEKNSEEKFIAINWNYNDDNVYKYVIYRAVDGKNFMTYKHIEPSEKQCKDYMIKQGAKYEYTVKVKFKDGRESGFGKIVAMEF
jgi:fibronectin type 3 domain-containing protein